MSSSSVPTRESDRSFYLFNAALSASALGLLAYLLLIRKGSGASVDLSFMPAINASLNATAATLLCLGYVAIKKKRADIHRYLMTSAFAASALFLVGYVVYHYVHGDTKYPGTGPIRTFYLVVLASHVLLSMAVVPLVLTSFYFAYKRAFARHRKVARVTLPIWLYVSVTGVLIFWMLRAATAA